MCPAVSAPNTTGYMEPEHDGSCCRDCARDLPRRCARVHVTEAGTSFSVISPSMEPSRRESPVLPDPAASEIPKLPDLTDQHLHVNMNFKNNNSIHHQNPVAIKLIKALCQKDHLGGCSPDLLKGEIYQMI